MDIHSAIDPLKVLRHLTAEQIERRISEIDGERAELATLLRSIRARECVYRLRGGRSSQGDPAHK